MTDINLNIFSDSSILDYRFLNKEYNIAVDDSISLSEIFGNKTIGGIEEFILSETITLKVEFDFSTYFRGLPFVDITMIDVDKVNLGGGYIQLIDNWNLTKKRFEIITPISTKAEILSHINFFKSNYKKSFYFTSPTDGIKYNVHFDQDSLRVEQSNFNTYTAKIIIEEIL